jgi:hypothetical protein
MEWERVERWPAGGLVSLDIHDRSADFFHALRSYLSGDLDRDSELNPTVAPEGKRIALDVEKGLFLLVNEFMGGYEMQLESSDDVAKSLDDEAHANLPGLAFRKIISYYIQFPKWKLDSDENGKLVDINVHLDFRDEPTINVEAMRRYDILMEGALQYLTEGYRKKNQLGFSDASIVT